MVILWNLFLGFMIFNFFSLYFININSDKKTHDTYFKSALKYSRSNWGNKQGDIQWKIAKKEKIQKNPFQASFIMYGFFGGFLAWVFLVPTLQWKLSTNIWSCLPSVAFHDHRPGQFSGPSWHQCPPPRTLWCSNSFLSWAGSSTVF